MEGCFVTMKNKFQDSGFKFSGFWVWAIVNLQSFLVICYWLIKMDIQHPSPSTHRTSLPNQKSLIVNLQSSLL